MSTFGGKIEEIPDISVDRFDSNNFHSRAYFLSHCHSDHMVGLSSKYFQNILLQQNKFIYTSDVSCEILKRTYYLIQNNIKVLDMYKPTIIMLGDKTISVTPIPAGHCPGSVMFLFENDTLVLYTGDYRIHKNDIKKFKPFYNCMNEVRAVEKIYLDTTFFLKSYFTFPKREDSLNEICKIIKEWTNKGKNHIVQLITSAKYGYEYVFNEIYKKIGMPIHVNRTVHLLYSVIPEMDNSVTVEDHVTQIHSNCGSSYQSICYGSCGKEIRRIKISAFRWTQDNLGSGLSSFVSDTYFVCYSTHASYEEGVELIKFLKPKSIEPCVKHDNPYNNVEMMELIEESLREIEREESLSDGPELFDTNSACAFKDSLSDPSSFDDNFGALNSPPKESADNLRRFLIKHSESFGLAKTCERLEIGSEIEADQKEFNFDREFGIDEPSSSMAVEKVKYRIETKINTEIDSTIIIEEKENSTYNDPDRQVEFSESIVKEKKWEKGGVKHVEDTLNRLGREPDSFSEWILNSPREKDSIFEKDKPNTTVISGKAENIGLGEIKQTEPNLSDVNINLSECESDLLKEIFFLKSSPPHNNEQKNNDSSEIRVNRCGNNDDELAFNSYIFRLIPENSPLENTRFDKNNTRDKQDSPPKKRPR